VNLYIADTVRCENPNTFTSNMLYSLSILYKSKLPMLVCFNKNDVLDHSFAIEWMKDFDILDKHLSKVDTYLSSLSRSLSLVLEEFYKNVEACGVSAKTGKGFEFMINDKIPKCKEEYYEIFYKEMQIKLKARSERQEDAMSALEGAMK
jgi:GPN-loop GTPase